MAEAQKEKESLKKHGDAMESAIHGTQGQGEKQRRGTGAKGDAIPMPESGAHEKSHAAHLGGKVHEHTKRQGAHPGASPGELPPSAEGRTRGQRG